MLTGGPGASLDPPQEDVRWAGWTGFFEYHHISIACPITLIDSP